MNIESIIFDSTFWTAFSAIATFVMTIATFLTLIQSKRQLKEMKSQWDESIRPRIEISLVTPPFAIPQGSIAIMLKNIGGSTAEINSVKILGDFFQRLDNELLTEKYKCFSNRKIYLATNESTCLDVSFVGAKNGGYTLNGQGVKKEVIEHLYKHLQDIDVHVQCNYSTNYVVDRILNTSTIKPYIRDIQYELSDIAFYLRGIENTIKKQ